MKFPRLVAAGALALLAACQHSSSPRVVDVDPEVRASLLDPVAGLAGTWTQVDTEEGGGLTQFTVSSGGSSVRETMFPGTGHEMTNMYTLDGNSLVMTHYCAGGNQPHMRATAVEGNRLVFANDGVSDLKSADEVYMGAMTLVLVDANHLEQHWQSYKDGEPDGEPMVFHWVKQP